MYYPDLTPITARDSDIYYMVGWLDKEHPFSKGKAPESFIDRLWLFCRGAEFLVYGYHYCSFCTNLPFGTVMEHNGETIKLGDGEIRVFTNKEGVFFASPSLIFHYVVDHQYSPPEEFIQAVLESPLPGSKEYKDAEELYCWF